MLRRLRRQGSTQEPGDDRALAIITAANLEHLALTQARELTRAEQASLRSAQQVLQDLLDRTRLTVEGHRSARG